MAKKEKSKSWLSKKVRKLQKQLREEKQAQQAGALVQKEVSITEAEDALRYSDVYTEWTPDTIESHSQGSGFTEFSCQSGIRLRVYVLSDTIFRLRYARKGKFPADFSYAIDPDFQPSEAAYVLEEKEKHFSIQTRQVVCKISKKSLKITFSNSEGKIICADKEGYYAKTTILKGTSEVRITHKAPPKTAYFGLGDKSGALNLRGQKLENWCTDAFGYGAKTDPLYRSIPFFLGLQKGLGYGIFFDNTFRSFFDFDEQNNGSLTFSAAGGEVDYYFIYGPELLSVAEQYTDLTGKPELPPLWSLGFHQCRWSYYPEARVLEVAKTFRELEIPCDAIYLDIDYMDGYRCFTWNKHFFPDPSRMIKDLGRDGFHTIVMIDPGIREDEDYFVYQEGVQKDYFCRRSDGSLMEGPVWPPNCGFPDFTREEVRAWWGDLYEELYKQQQVSGFWNDMNEPAVFRVDSCTFPDDVLHHYDGHPTNHAKAHNIYGLNMSRASMEGLKKLRPQKRPFLVTRATFSGGQRYAAVWTGDNQATWEHLQIGNRQCQRLSASGFSFTGTDIGGFFQYPTGELFTRWMQLGVFHPFFRVHSMGNNEDGQAEADAEKVRQRDMINRLDQEPWAFGEPWTSASRAAINLRYQLLPYVYTTFWQYIQEGTPMIRSLFFYDQKDARAVGREREFIFGDHLLVAPVTKPEVEQVKVYLPKGKWYCYWNGQKYKGGKSYKIKVSLDDFPFFVLEGAAIAHYPVMQYTGEKKVEELTVKVFGMGNTQSSYLYEDAGEGYNYQNGDYALSVFTTEKQGPRHLVTRKKSGNRKNDYSTICLEFLGLKNRPESCNVDGQSISTIKMDKGWQIQVPADFQRISWGK